MIKAIKFFINSYYEHLIKNTYNNIKGYIGKLLSQDLID